MKTHKSKSILVGTMITAGTAIGAGMFSLPVVSSGLWFIGGIIFLALIWYLNYLSALVLLEVNVHFPPGASFDTFVTAILGKTWNVLNGLGIAFLLCILLYAYFSGLGSIASYTLGWEVSETSQWTRGGLSLLLGSILAFMVWVSTTAVGRLSTLLVVGMAVAYIASMSGLALHVESAKLFNTGDHEAQYAPYLWVTLPYFLTAFGFSAIVPSLYKHYGKEPIKIKNGILYGSLLSLAVYIIFIAVSFGTISRPEFIPIKEAGGNMGDLVAALTKNNDGAAVNFALNLFANFAIISSFLGAGLSLFDYVADIFKFSDDGKGRFYTACVTFLPSGIASFFFPNGFIAAIGFAGLVMVFSLILIPVLMAWKIRKTKEDDAFKLFGGKFLLILILLISAVIVVCHILAMMNYLPVY